MGYDQMRQDNVVNPASKEYTSPLTGGSGKYFTLKGVTVKVGENSIPLKVVPEAKNSIDFAFEGLCNNGVWNQICGSDTCNVSARLRPSATAFKAKKFVADGTRLPFDGLQPVGHVRGQSVIGHSEYFYQPLFLNGDMKLYTQQYNLYTGEVDGMASKFTIQPQLLQLLAPLTQVTPDQIINSLSRHTSICKKTSCYHILTSRLVQAWQLLRG
jgi:hypothetical protein